MVAAEALVNPGSSERWGGEASPQKATVFQTVSGREEEPLFIKKFKQDLLKTGREDTSPHLLIHRADYSSVITITSCKNTQALLTQQQSPWGLNVLLCDMSDFWGHVRLHVLSVCAFSGYYSFQSPKSYTEVDWWVHHRKYAMESFHGVFPAQADPGDTTGHKAGKIMDGFMIFTSCTAQWWEHWWPHSLDVLSYTTSDRSEPRSRKCIMGAWSPEQRSNPILVRGPDTSSVKPHMMRLLCNDSTTRLHFSIHITWHAHLAARLRNRFSSVINNSYYDYDELFFRVKSDEDKLVRSQTFKSTGHWSVAPIQDLQRVLHLLIQAMTTAEQNSPEGNEEVQK